MMKKIVKLMTFVLILQVFVGSLSFAMDKSSKMTADEYYNKLDKEIYSDFGNADINIKERVQVKDLVGVSNKLDDENRRRFERIFENYISNNSQKTNQFVYVFISVKNDATSKRAKYTIIDSQSNKVLVTGNAYSPI